MTETHLIPTYKRQPVAFTRGDGAWLWDEAGNRYLDALSGIAVNVLGHNHPRLTAALRQQAGDLIHTSNLYRIPLQERLGEALCRRAGMDAAFFCNSGAEANEAAIKLARLHGHRRGIEKPAIVVAQGAFHGRTLATLAATAGTKARDGFEPLPEGFLRVPYGDAAAIAALADNPRIAAVLVEPIQGEGGVRMPPDGYLRELRALCDTHGWLLMLDEVQTGVGRTGSWFAHQHESVRPDVMSLAKALGGGVPIGAALVAGAARELFGPGSHGSTFGGGPLACRAALAVIEAIDEEGLLERAARLGEWIRDDLRQRLSDLRAVRDIRGRGLMIGVELDRPCADLVERARANSVLLNVTADSVVRLLPPLILEQEQAEQITATLALLIRELVEA